VGVGARNLAECLQLQLPLLQRGEAEAVVQTALPSAPSRWTCWRGAMCAAQPPGRRSEERTRAAMALIARLEPRPAGALSMWSATSSCPT
jgi:RNA polymerase sigma-54 factor